MRCVRNWLLIKKHVWRKEGNFVENATVKIWNLYDTFNVKRNKLLETIGMYTGCIARASTQICVKYRPTSKSYIQGQSQLCARYFWHDRSTSSQYNIAIEHSRSFFFLRTKYYAKLCFIRRKKKKKKNRFLAPLRWPEMRRHNPGINQARHLRHTRVCSISILRVAVVSRTSRDIRYTQLGARDKELTRTHMKSFRSSGAGRTGSLQPRCIKSRA